MAVGLSLRHCVSQKTLPASGLFRWGKYTFSIYTNKNNVLKEMKRLPYFPALLLMAAFMAACGNADHKAEEALKNEVFVIHDDVMPKTKDIKSLQKQIRDAKKKKQNALDPDTDRRAVEVLAQLQKAYDGMMVWMNNFKSPAKLRSSKSHQEIMEYLNDEKSKIEQVRDDMLSSIEAGKTMLNELK